MANLKNITDLPVAESADGLNLIVNDNGAAKQIAASAVGAQADWNETDENSPAFVKNKPDVALKGDLPVEEYDLDIEVTINIPDSEGNRTHSYVVNYMNTFENIKNKMVNRENLKYKVKFFEQENIDFGWYLNIIPQIQYCIGVDGEYICFGFVGYTGYKVWLMLNPDNTIVDDT